MSSRRPRRGAATTHRPDAQPAMPPRRKKKAVVAGRLRDGAAAARAAAKATKRPETPVEKAVASDEPCERDDAAAETHKRKASAAMARAGTRRSLAGPERKSAKSGDSSLHGISTVAAAAAPRLVSAVAAVAAIRLREDPRKGRRAFTEMFRSPPARKESPSRRLVAAQVIASWAHLPKTDVAPKWLTALDDDDEATAHARLRDLREVHGENALHRLRQFLEIAPSPRGYFADGARRGCDVDRVRGGESPRLRRG